MTTRLSSNLYQPTARGRARMLALATNVGLGRTVMENLTTGGCNVAVARTRCSPTPPAAATWRPAAAR
jgi:hypothetical protein